MRVAACFLLMSHAAPAREDILLDAPSHGLDSGNAATLELVKRTLASTSPPIDKDIIRQSGACTGTDGAYAPSVPVHAPLCRMISLSMGGEVDASVRLTNSNVAAFPLSKPWLGASSKMSSRAGAA